MRARNSGSTVGREARLPLVEVAGEKLDRQQAAPLQLVEGGEQRVAVLAAREADEPARRPGGPCRRSRSPRGSPHDALAQLAELGRSRARRRRAGGCRRGRAWAELAGIRGGRNRGPGWATVTSIIRYIWIMPRITRCQTRLMVADAIGARDRARARRSLCPVRCVLRAAASPVFPGARAGLADRAARPGSCSGPGRRRPSLGCSRSAASRRRRPCPSGPEQRGWACDDGEEYQRRVEGYARVRRNCRVRARHDPCAGAAAGLSDCGAAPILREARLVAADYTLYAPPPERVRRRTSGTTARPACRQARAVSGNRGAWRRDGFVRRATDRGPHHRDGVGLVRVLL